MIPQSSTLRPRVFSYTTRTHKPTYESLHLLLLELHAQCGDLLLDPRASGIQPEPGPKAKHIGPLE